MSSASVPPPSASTPRSGGEIGLLDLTDAQRRTLVVLGDHQWHPGSRTGAGGTVIGTPACALVRLGLAERKGASRTADPRNPGFSYRITERGAATLTAWAEDLVPTLTPLSDGFVRCPFCSYILPPGSVIGTGVALVQVDHSGSSSTSREEGVGLSPSDEERASEGSSDLTSVPPPPDPQQAAESGRST